MMEYLDRAISDLMGLLFRPADRAEIDKTIKEVIDLLETSKKELKKKSKK